MKETAALNNQQTTSHQILNKMKELVYQGRNAEFFEKMADMDFNRISPKLARDLELLHASLLFEMHRVDEATEIVRSMLLAKPDGWMDHAIMHTVARFAYMEGDLDKAFDLFESIVQYTESREMRIKALIGVANVHFAKDRIYAAAKVLQELETLEPFGDMDSRLGLIHLQAMRCLHIDKNPSMAQQMFGMGLKLSSERGWNFFILRFLYASAKIERDHGKKEALDCYLSLIRDLVSLQQSGYFCYLYNETFKAHDRLIYSFIEIDAVYRRVLIGNRWVDLTSHPEVFNLLRFLRNEDRFVDVKEIVAFLYPNQAFSKQIHLPIILDLVDQARKRVEAYHKQPRALLSQESSFRLVAS